MNPDYSLFANVVPNETTSNDIESPNTMSMIENSEPERLVLYRNAVQETLRKINASVSDERFVEMFKEIPSFNQKYNAINKEYNILTKAIHDQMNKQIELQIKDDELHEKFTVLEKLIKANATKTDNTVWRPTHSVEDHLRSYVMKEKIKYKEQLKHLVSLKEDTVNKLKYDVTADRNRLKAIEERMEAVEQKLASIHDSSEDFLNSL